MGQGFSSHAGSESTSRRLNRHPELAAQGESSRSNTDQDQEEGEQSLLVPNVSRSAGPLSSRLSSIATFHRQTHSVPAVRDSTVSDGGISTTGNMVLEQEERPLVSMEDLRIPDAPITDITASPMPTRSTLWRRLGSRRARRNSTIEMMRSQELTGDIAVQQSLSDEMRAEHSSTRQRRRHSMLSSFPSIFGPHTQPSRRHLAPISRPIPISEDWTSQYDMIGTARAAPTPEQSQNTSGIGSPARNEDDRRSRLSRVRRSISGPLEVVFGSNQRGRLRNHEERSSRRSSMLEETGDPTPDEMQYLLPPISLADQAISLEDSTADPEAAAENSSHRDASFNGMPEPTERPRSWAQRLADLAPSSRRESRSTGFNLLRGRSSRLIRRDDEAPLSRILQLAATAIAAQLSGRTDALVDLESAGDDHFDGGLNNFVEELNSATGAVSNANSESSSAAAPSAPLNFWRVFRFVSPTEGPPERAADSGTADPRTVTLVVVGVRSVPSSSIQRESGGDHSLDSLFGGPQERPSPGGLLRRLNRARLDRRSSVAGSTPFPQQYDSQRHQRTRPLSSIPASGSRPDPVFAPISAGPDSLRRSRTISDPYHGRSLSPGYSMTETRSSSPHVSSYSPADSLEHQANTIGRLRNNRSRSPPPLGHDVSRDQAVRQRRRSGSESARHFNLGAGASRRNGTIDPDGGPVQGRSWLIYVVGTNLPEDHPAFTTPSLFTDNPSYEDMILLSNILGPVKPPVASSDDVAASGGTYRLARRDADGSLHARAVDDQTEMTILSTDACQVCLEAYVPEQLIRKLSKCAHMFHQECVDEVCSSSAS